jgi:hypothetical protein
MYPTEMTREQRLFLVNLNNRLSEIEQQIKKEALEIIDTMNERVEDDADWINDYEIECTVEFYLDENDPAYSDDEDNLQAEFTEGVRLLRYADHSLLASADNWNDCGIPDMDDPNKNEHHCWFYHQLYDHAKLSWENMLRIGDIWVDINLTLQHHLKLSGKEAL